MSAPIAETMAKDDASGEPGAARRSRAHESTFRRKALSLALFLILAASVLNALFGERGVLGWMRAEQDFRRLELEVTLLEEQNHELRNEIERLRSDPLAVERRAREVLGMVRPGELMIQVMDR